MVMTLATVPVDMNWMAIGEDVEVHTLTYNLQSLDLLTHFFPLPTDINECTTNDPCHHQCTNIPGTFACSCEEGYDLGPNRVFCQG